MKFDFFELQKRGKFPTNFAKNDDFQTPNAKRYLFFPAIWPKRCFGGVLGGYLLYFYISKCILEGVQAPLGPAVRPGQARPGQARPEASPGQA